MKKVTLTFDNGPTVATTPSVLDELAARDLPAVFCVVGRQLEKGREQVAIVRETLARGHQVINHSLTHGVALGDDPSAAHARSEIVQMDSRLTKELRDWGEPWFRPFGRGGQLGKHVFSPAAVEELRRLSYSVLLWNCVPRDWEEPVNWVDTALGELDRLDHAVVVLHDLDTGAMRELPRFLDALVTRGVEITRELPSQCVPMRHGEVCWPAPEFEALVA